MVRKKRVCVKCVTPIFDVIPNRPILGQINSIELTVDQIRKCLVKKANVREILEDGQYKVLTLSNYDEFDDEPVLNEPVQEIVETKIPEDEKEVAETEEVSSIIDEITPAVEEVSAIIDEITPVVEEVIHTEVVEEIPGVVEEMIQYTEEEIPTVVVDEEQPIETKALTESEETTILVEEPIVENVTKETEYRPSNNNHNNKKKNRR